LSWYYTREAGDQGQVLTDEGTPPGVCISDIVREGPLPMGVALELIAYLADVLTIAQEDKALHGDVSPGDVFIDDKGSVSLSGYGPMRAQGRAPEGRPLFPASDVYGLGVVLHSVLATEPLGAIPRTRDAHDDAIVDKLLSIDWTALAALKGRDSLIHFLCSMLAHDPTERPAPLDVANVLAGTGMKISAVGVASWAKARWKDGSRIIDEELPTIGEVLAAPAELGRVFNKTGQYSRRQSASAKGECTAFWSKDKIETMLDEGEDPLAGSAMFQRSALADMLGGASDSVIRSPPPPPRPADDYPEQMPWAPDSTISGKPDDPDLVAAMAALKAQAEARKPVAPPEPERPAMPVNAPPPESKPPPSVSPPPLREVPKRATPWRLVLLISAGISLFLAILVAAGFALFFYMTDAERHAEPTAIPEPAVEEAAAAPAPAPSTKKTKTRRKPKSKPKPKPKRSAAKAKAAAKRAPPSPPPAPAGEFDVTFRSMGAEAKLECGDGQTGRFMGVTRRKFSDVTTCRVTIDGVIGAVQVRRPSTVNCSVSGAAVRCTGA
jgi:hypothetical protein